MAKNNHDGDLIKLALPVEVAGLIARTIGTDAYREIFHNINKTFQVFPADLAIELTYITREYLLHVSSVAITATAIKKMLPFITKKLDEGSAIKKYANEHPEVVAAAIAFAIGVAVEVAQHFFPALGGSELRDVVMDGVGAALVVAFPVIAVKMEQSGEMIRACLEQWRQQHQQQR